ncbi:hypothetical protein FRB99_003342 [Tulasnella sp. 403]|nr:hypothetical protein FRB99_003342 [Tulasnella sp. 403]
MGIFFSRAPPTPTVVLSHEKRKRKVAMNPGLVISGNFSDLYSGTEASLGTVALKRCRAVKDQKKLLEKEAEIWKRFTHDNVLKFLGVGKDKEGTLYLVSPWMENRSLWDYIDSHPDCDRPQFLRETAAALAYLHSQNVIHGDVKAQNILISPTLHALLCDFGLSKVLSGLMPFATYSTATAIINAATKGERPVKDPKTFPEGSAYESYFGIASLCWVEDPADRPSMEDVRRLLQDVGSTVEVSKPQEVTPVVDGLTTITLDDHSTVETSLTAIDVGSSSDIFEGHHLGQKVALKRARIHNDSSSQAEALKTEAAIWSKVKDFANILPFLGCGVDPEGLLYLASPYMDYGNLWAHVQTCISNGEECDRPKYLREIAGALSHVHSKGIVHGDVKALNILISADDHAYLCDFGSARQTSSLDAPPPASCTPRHMSPELWLHPDKPSTEQSDVYAFGITICEVLGGEVPFYDIGDDESLKKAVIEGSRPPSQPSESLRGVSYATLWEIANDCWSTNPEDRPTMQAVVDKLGIS